MQIDCSLQIIKITDISRNDSSRAISCMSEEHNINVHINVRRIFILNLNFQNQYFNADIWRAPPPPGISKVNSSPAESEIDQL